MKKLLVFLISFGFVTFTNAQSSYLTKDIIVTQKKNINVGSLSSNSDYFPQLTHLQFPTPGSPAKGTTPINPNNVNRSTKEISLDAQIPILLRNFEGNQQQNGTPNDNDLAISNNGIIVSVINSNIAMYNQGGELLKEISLEEFSSAFNIINIKYDPKVLFDPIEEKFILVYLNGNLDSTSRIIVAFSQTSDPTGDWNVYMLNGNPLDNKTWSDYPSIGISNEDLFISFNTFFNGSENNSGFVEGTFWQINKSDGYTNKDELRTRYYSNILPGASRAIFNTNPVNGSLKPYGNHFYLISNLNREFESDLFYICKVTNSLSSGNAQLEVRELRSDVPYYESINAEQFYTRQVKELRTNDSRVLGALLHKGVLHAVGNTKTQRTNGIPTFYHLIVENFDKLGEEPQLNIYPTDTLQLGFPRIAFCGNDTDKQTFVIATSYAGKDIKAGCGALFFEENKYSKINIVKEGEGIINILPQTADRWGDYTGIQTKYNEPALVWMGGNYAKTDASANFFHRNGTWIAEYANPNNWASVKTASKTAIENTKLYPNPVKKNQFVSVEFNANWGEFYDFVITDINGRVLKTIIKNNAKAGLNRFTITPPSSLSSGAYFLQIRNSSTMLGTQKFVID